MRPSLMLSAMFISLAFALTAAAAEPTLTLDVWPGKAPGETGSIGPEKVLDQKPGCRGTSLRPPRRWPDQRWWSVTTW